MAKKRGKTRCYHKHLVTGKRYRLQFTEEEWRKLGAPNENVLVCLDCLGWWA